MVQRLFLHKDLNMVLERLGEPQKNGIMSCCCDWKNIKANMSKAEAEAIMSCLGLSNRKVLKIEEWSEMSERAEYDFEKIKAEVESEKAGVGNRAAHVQSVPRGFGKLNVHTGHEDKLNRYRDEETEGHDFYRHNNTGDYNGHVRGHANVKSRYEPSTPSEHLGKSILPETEEQTTMIAGIRNKTIKGCYGRPLTEQNELERSRDIAQKQQFEISRISEKTIYNASRNAIKFLIWKDKQDSELFSGEQRAAIAISATKYGLECDIKISGLSAEAEIPSLDQMFQEKCREVAEEARVWGEAVQEEGQIWDNKYGKCFPDLLRGHKQKTDEEKVRERMKMSEYAGRQLMLLGGKPELIANADEEDMKLIASMLKTELVQHPSTLEAWYNRASQLKLPLDLKRMALSKTQGGIIQADCKDGYIVLPQAKETHESLIAKLESLKCVQLSEEPEAGKDAEGQTKVSIVVPVGEIDWGRGLDDGEKLLRLEKQLSELWNFCINKAIKMQEGKIVFTIQGFDALWEQCGLCGVSDRAGWINQLGELRKAINKEDEQRRNRGNIITRIRNNLTVSAAIDKNERGGASWTRREGKNNDSFRFTGDLEQLIEAVREAGMVCSISDGAALSGETGKRAGSAVHMFGIPQEFQELKNTGAKNERSLAIQHRLPIDIKGTNNAAELDGVVIQKLLNARAGTKIIGTDSKYAIYTTELEDSELIAAMRRNGRSRLPNRKMILLSRCISMLDGSKEIFIHTRGHAGCEIQDAIDRDAKSAAEMEEDASVAHINMGHCVEFIAAWSTDAIADKAFALRKIMNEYVWRIKVEATDVNRLTKYAKAMIPSNVAVYNLIQKCTDQIQSEGEECEVIQRARNAFLRADKIWREDMLEKAVECFPIIKKKKNGQRASLHTKEYLIKVEIYKVLKERIRQINEAIRSAWEEMDSAEVFRIYRIFFEANQGKDPVDATMNTRQQIEWVQEVCCDCVGRECFKQKPPTRAIGSVREAAVLMQRAEELVMDLKEELNADKDNDAKREKYARMHGTWMKRGPSKHLFRTMAQAECPYTFAFEVQPEEFINYIVGKTQLDAVKFKQRARAEERLTSRGHMTDGRSGGVGNQRSTSELERESRSTGSRSGEKYSLWEKFTDDCSHDDAAGTLAVKVNGHTFSTNGLWKDIQQPQGRVVQVLRGTPSVRGVECEVNVNSLRSPEGVEEPGWRAGDNRAIISKLSIEEFGKPWTAAEIKKVILNFKLGKTTSATAKVPKELFKGILEVQEAMNQNAEVAGNVCDVLAIQFETMQKLEVAPEEWNRVALSPIIKLNKIDFARGLSTEEVNSINRTPKFWREVGIVDTRRGIFGACLFQRYVKFNRDNHLNKHCCGAYMPDCDAIKIQHDRINLIQAMCAIARPMPGTHVAMCAIVLECDADSFFSRIKTEGRERLMAYLQMPENIRKGIRATHEKQALVMATGDGLTQEVRFDAEIMGCGDSLLMANAIALPLFDNLRRADLGFVWPCIWENEAPPEAKFFGNAHCDDFSLITGGYRVTIEEAIENMKKTAEIVTEWACDYMIPFDVKPTDPQNSKATIQGWARDEYGSFIQKINIEIQLPTVEGLKTVPIIRADESRISLGILRTAFFQDLAIKNYEHHLDKMTDKLSKMVNRRAHTDALQYTLSTITRGGFKYTYRNFSGLEH